jgi:hypothetical protein
MWYSFLHLDSALNMWAQLAAGLSRQSSSPDDLQCWAVTLTGPAPRDCAGRMGSGRAAACTGACILSVRSKPASEAQLGTGMSPACHRGDSRGFRDPS